MELPLDLQQYEEYASIDAENMPPESPCALYILPAAFEEIKSHIEWRVQSAYNRYEQGGILIGDVYKDPETQIVYGLVKSVIPSPISGDETYLKFTQESWIEMHKALDRKKASTPDGGQMRILGWYHTHPNMRVEMSNVDQNTHRKFFSQYWQFSVIFNPQRGIWSVFNGADCLNCRGKLFCSQADYDKKAYITGVTALPANVNAGWYSFPKDRAGNGTKRAGTATGRAENGEERKTFNITSRTDPQPPLPPPAQPAQQTPAASVHRPTTTTHKTRNNVPSVPHGHVIKNAVQTIVNAVAPPDAFTFSQFLYQRTNERMLVIQRELVEELIQKAKLQNYLSVKNELILLYPLKSPENLYYMWNGVPHYTFENHVGSSIKATGFWYITDSGQYVEYLEREQSPDCVNLAVVYSNRPVNKNKLCDWHDVCGMCDCVLWVNLRNKNQTPFYTLPKFYSPLPFSVRFPHKPGCSVLRESADILSESQLSSRVQSGWIYFDASTSNEANAFKIRPDFIQRLFEQLRRVQMSSDYCVAVTYGTGVDPTDDHAMTLLNERFLNIRVLSPRDNAVDIDAEFFNTTYQDSATDGTPKLVFLFSGGDIDVEEMKRRLFGRDSALILNVEDAQHFRLCRLFPNR
ncbi:MAG: hypothetical protein IJQ81_05120 [Oscillibacter sp.]|nr:hypothetical protein [Oscillibacter sp.]